MLKAIAIAALGFAACTPDGGGGYGPLVFPAEAELGGTVAVVIDSNYIPDFSGSFGDTDEQHDLSRNRVAITVVDAGLDEYPVVPRAVFPLEVSPLSTFGSDNPGAWVMVALFDLPTDQAFDYSVPAKLELSDTVTGKTVTGSIRITGPGGDDNNGDPIGGQPTTIVVPGLTTLEPQNLTARLRVVQVTGGIPPDAVIAGLEFDVAYYACLLPPAVYAMGEGRRANVFAGGVTQLPDNYSSQHIVMFDPAGFMLSDPTGNGQVLGESPILDIVFADNTIFPGCGLPEHVTLSNVFAVAPDGSTIIDQRGIDPETVPAPPQIFALHWISTD